MKPNVTIKTGIVWGEELPNQLIIRKGKIVLKNGQTPIFNITDGTEINVFPREYAMTLVDSTTMYRAQTA